MLSADANFEVNTRSIYARNYDFLSVAIKKISTVLIGIGYIYPHHPQGPSGALKESWLDMDIDLFRLIDDSIDDRYTMK